MFSLCGICLLVFTVLEIKIGNFKIYLFINYYINNCCGHPNEADEPKNWHKE